MKNFKRKEQKQMGNKGFSLVELIVVIAIMAVLVAVLAPQFTRYVDKSRQSNDATTVAGIVNAVQAGIADVTSYNIPQGEYVVTLEKKVPLKVTNAGTDVPAEGDINKPGNIVNAIQDACGELKNINTTANAWNTITITIKVSADGTNITYASDPAGFAEYIGKNTTQPSS